METAMEQRNATATLASYGQDTGDFGPETDVDTPEEPIGLTKPLVEGEANVIDESGEDSEEDGGGWNYYNKTTEGTEKKTTYQENDKTGNNSDAEDMDYKLNLDAPKLIPVSSPIPPINHAQRFLEMDNDDFIPSSPKKYKESIDGEDVPDENDFTNEIKVNAADLSKLNNPYEPNDSTMLNGIKPLSDEVSGNNENTDNSIIKNEHVTNGNLEKYQNPFASVVDLNKVQDLSEYLNDSDQTYKTDPYVSIIETNKKNEINSTYCDNVLQHESNVKLNDDLSSLNEHMKYDFTKYEIRNSTNTDDTFNTTNATTGSTFQQGDESFKYGDGFKSDFMESNHVHKFGLCDDQKLNDSVSTTDAVLSSEPHTPMRMDNQSTFESENNDDQFSESFKHQLKFNQFDENNDKENHDPFCFEQSEDPAGTIPNVTHEVNEEVNKTHHGDIVQFNKSSNKHQVFKLTTYDPVIDTLCVKDQVKPIHSDLYERQSLPESDFTTSTREALMKATESEFNHQVIGVNNEQLLEDSKIETHVVNKLGHPNVDKHLEQEQYNLKHEVPSHTDDEDVDNDVDNVKVYLNDNTCNNEQENNSVNLINNHGENSEVVHNDEHSNEDKSVEYYKQEIYVSDIIKERIEDPDDRFNFEIMMHGGDGKKEYNAEENCVEDSKQDNYSFAEFEKHTEEIKQDYCENVVEDILSNVHDLHYQNQLSVSNIINQVENIVEVAQSHIEDVEETHNALPNLVQNHVEVFIQEHHDVTEEKPSHLEYFKQEYCDTVKLENNHENFIPEHHNITEVTHNDHVECFKQKERNSIEVENGNVDDFKQGHFIVPIEIHTAEIDEELHSSMIIHSDVENNTPQTYCSSHDTLLNETYMMCTSMAFEENFQNRNMSDSLFVMETNSDYFGDDVKSATQLDKPINEPKANEQSLPIDSKLVESTNIETEIVTEAKSESSQLYSQDLVEKIDKQEDSNKIAEISVAAAVGTAAIAAVTGTSLVSKKFTPKKTEATVSKATKTKTTSTKPLDLKTSAPIKKTTSSTTTSKPLSRPITAPSSTAKPMPNVRPTTVPKVTAMEATTITITAPKNTVLTIQLTSSKTTPTTPRVSLAKTTFTSSPRTSTVTKTSVATKSATTPKTSTTSRSSTLVRKQPLTNGSLKPLSRPISTPAKKSLSSATSNGTTKLTNGLSSKTSASTKPPVTLATRISLAPPKLPPKVKDAPKTVTPLAMPGPIKRPNAPITKKTKTATS